MNDGSTHVRGNSKRGQFSRADKEVSGKTSTRRACVLRAVQWVQWMLMAGGNLRVIVHRSLYDLEGWWEFLHNSVLTHVAVERLYSGTSWCIHIIRTVGVNLHLHEVAS